MTDVTVSVFMLTYNQEKFIAQAIESVLMQKLDFAFELVIGEDASTDKTPEICKKYERKYPEIVKLKSHRENIGLIENFIQTYKRCKGKYVAILDGDDYWTDPYKLIKQVGFMEENPNSKICFTRIKNLFPNNYLVTRQWKNLKDPSNFDDLIFHNIIPSVSAFIRKEDNSLPSWIHRFPYGDWPLYLWLLRNGGTINLIEGITGVYRREIGVSEKMRKVPSKIAKVNLGIVEAVQSDQNFKHRSKIIVTSLTKHRYDLMACYFREEEFFRSIHVANLIFWKEPLKVLKSYVYLLKRKFLVKNSL
ncbi:glycosyltransferase [Gramella sp. AN32]|uniref:Glycosyltransferase n=1 Tax=Christiangramia antarctica TaxID=2058158 RepID=A0ABW5X8G9_9FLAO|nr:glycosyltransferase [Gramella sp. AN32]MCM4154711.1 glycosyl transferase [Gramella sp. AN32]